LSFGALSETLKSLRYLVFIIGVVLKLIFLIIEEFGVSHMNGLTSIDGNVLKFPSSYDMSRALITHLYVIRSSDSSELQTYLDMNSKRIFDWHAVRYLNYIYGDVPVSVSSVENLHNVAYC